MEGRVQRGLYYAIIDEVDSVLIDESRTPLILSGYVGTNYHHTTYKQIYSQRAVEEMRM